MMFTGKKVLVTGGMGFIGSNLSRRLVELGAEVTIVDNQNSDGGATPINIEDFKDNVIVTDADVRDTLAMKWAIVDKDYIFNLAGQTSHKESMIHPHADLDINAKAQLDILELCRNYNPKVKIVFASTRQLYGRPKYLPVDEQHPINPIDVNGINKWAGEHYHLLYNNVYGIKASVLRLTNTYGEGMRIKDAKQMFLGIWIRLLLEKKPFLIMEGHHLRDFNYVSDVVDAFLLAAGTDKANGQVYNLGGNQCSLKNLGDMLLEVNGGGIGYLEDTLPPERMLIDIGDYYSDYTKITNELKWKPKVCLYEGLGKTLDYYRNNYRRYL
jgi:UDP-glucose 4-epimerase